MVASQRRSDPVEKLSYSQWRLETDRAHAEAALKAAGTAMLSLVVKTTHIGLGSSV
jgi:hypothetical protein